MSLRVRSESFCSLRPIVHSHRPGSRRGGYVYLAVLFTSLIVAASVAAALSISLSTLRGENDRTHRSSALRFAESELHRQAAMMRTSGQWRTESTSGVFSPWYTLPDMSGVVSGNLELRRRYTDADGVLDDDDTDSVELTIHARVGRSESAIIATLEPDPDPFDLLQYSVTVTNDLRFESGGAISCENPVQVVRKTETQSSGVLTTPRLECNGVVEMTLRGDLSPAAVTIPTRDVLGGYIQMGTEIPNASIPRDNGDLLIQDIVLSSTMNPYGPLDARGIYWFDAGGQRVRLSHCRIDATLAIRNSSRIKVKGGITWNFPTSADAILVSDSNIRFTGVEATLDEAARGVNFNPSLSPYRQTLSNTTLTDLYPSELRGVIYTSGNVRLNPLVNDKSLHVTGAIICRNFRVDGFMTVTSLEELLDTPPIGLSDPTPMRFVRGTQRRIPSP